MSRINSSTIQARDTQVISGIQKNLQTVSSLPIAGTTFTPPDLVKLVQSRIDLANKIAAAEASWHAQVLAGQALGKKLTPILRGLRQYVLNAYGETSPVLADFGFKPPKQRVLTPEEKAAAALKAKATRAARHTMGKVQKKSVKGTVPAPLGDGTKAPSVSTPVVAAPAPTPKPAS